MQLTLPRRRFLITLVLFGVAWATLWYLRSWNESQPDYSKRELPPVDYYAERAVVTATDDSGATLYRVAAERLEHLHEKAESELTKIKLDYHGREGELWKVTSDSGFIDDARTVMLLRDHVHITREAGDYTGDIRTAELLVYPESHTAHSTAGVVIRQEHSNIRADSLWLDFKAERLKLRGNVMTHFVPNTKPAEQPEATEPTSET